MDYDGTNKYIRITDIDDETSKYKSEKLTSPSFIDNSCIVNENDILFARTGASTGKTYLYQKNDGLLYFAGFLIRANVSKDFNPYFVFLQTKTNKYLEWVGIMSCRSGQPGINAQEYKKLPIYLTDIQSQNKVANFFRFLDTRIETQSKIIDNIESLISGIRYQVFARKNRKFTSSDVRQLGDFLEEYSKKNINNNLISVAVGKYGIRKRDEIYSKELSSDYSKNKVIEKDTLCIGMGSSQIDIGILTEDIRYCVSPAYTTYRITDINSSYLNEYLIYLNKLLSKRYMIIGARQGKSVNKKELLMHELEIHSIDEQLEIVKIFSALKEKLEKEKDILELYKKQKAYLLQNLFI